MKKFYHYGVEIEVKSSTNGAEADLKNAKIEYTVLPFIDDKVIRYYCDNQRYYAYCTANWETGETVYITAEFPEDGNWKKIAEDCKNQLLGQAPMQLPTRARVMYDEAKKIVNGYRKHSAKDFESYFKSPTKLEINWALVSLGTSIDELKANDYSDTPELDELEEK